MDCVIFKLWGDNIVKQREYCSTHKGGMLHILLVGRRHQSSSIVGSYPS